MAYVNLTNLISNGGIETNTTGWASAGGFSGTVSRIAVPSPVHGEVGSWCLQSSGQFNSSQGGGVNRIAVQLSTGISVTANHVYYIRAQVRAVANCTTCEINNNGTSIGHSMVDVGTNVWNLVDLIYVPAANTTLQLRLQFGGATSGNNTTTLQVDNVMMIDLTTAFGAGSEPPDSVIRNAILDYTLKGFWDGTQSVYLATAPVIDVVNTFLPLAVKGKSYSGQVEIEGGTGTAPFTFSLLGLPSGHGLSINSSGVVSGTCGLNEGSYNFSVSVSDSVGYLASQSFTLNVKEPPVIEDSYIPGGAVGEPYSFTPTVTGSSDNLFFAISVTSGTLPSGLSITNGDTSIGGTPSATGTCQITVSAENDYGDVFKVFTFGVYAAPSINTLSPLSNAILGASYSVTFTASGATPITWLVSSGSLPGGLYLSSSGVLSGTPSAVGTFSFYVKAENSVGDDTKQFTVAVYELPNITTTTLGYARIGSSYSAVLNATGSAPITWLQLSGSIPPGLSLSTSGVISGTPLTTGAYTFTVEARNVVGAVTKQFTITAGDSLAITTTSPLPNGVLGAAYTTLAIQVAGINTSEAYTFSWAAQAGSSLPPGLSFSAGTVAAYAARGTQGQISGTPSATGVYNINITVVNGTASATTPFTISVFSLPVINNVSFEDLTVGVSYSAIMDATGSTPITWTVVTPVGGETGLPPGLSLSTSGVLSGTPLEAGDYSFKIQASNGAGSDTVSFLMTVVAIAAVVGGRTWVRQKEIGRFFVRGKEVLQAYRAGQLFYSVGDGEPELPVDISIIFSGLVADGSSSVTTTKLTLVFSQDIDGLSASDISLSAGSTGAVKGAFMGVGLGIYELALTGIVAGGSVTVGVSKDGYDISPSSLSTTVYKSDVAAVPADFLLIPNGNANTVQYSMDNGTTFNVSDSLPASLQWRKAAYGDGIGWVIVGGNKGAFSEDGVAWEEVTLPTVAGSVVWVDVAYSPSLHCFVAIAGEAATTISAKSTDGKNWTAMSGLGSEAWLGVAWCGDRFFAVASGASNASRLSYSVDGSLWSNSGVAATGIVNFSVGYAYDRIIVTSSASSAPKYSTNNGASWTNIPGGGVAYPFGGSIFALNTSFIYERSGSAGLINSKFNGSSFANYDWCENIDDVQSHASASYVFGANNGVVITAGLGSSCYVYKVTPPSSGYMCTYTRVGTLVGAFYNVCGRGV